MNICEQSFLAHKYLQSRPRVPFVLEFYSSTSHSSSPATFGYSGSIDLSNSSTRFRLKFGPVIDTHESFALPQQMQNPQISM